MISLFLKFLTVSSKINDKKIFKIFFIKTDNRIHSVFTKISTERKKIHSKLYKLLLFRIQKLNIAPAVLSGLSLKYDCQDIGLIVLVSVSSCRNNLASLVFPFDENSPHNFWANLNVTSTESNFAAIHVLLLVL